ncbi:Uncharacterised protein [Mycobacteroides abscessus subsp. abscessus]|nr:Uncharacterised protein [Mycobacteroides abscessus subsp. abscessus]
MKSLGLTTRSSKAIIEWYVPHISTQRPTNAPSFRILLTWKTLSELLALGSGITSRVNRNGTTRNEWMTSAEASWNSMLLPLGTTSTGISEEVPTVSILSKFR